DVSLCVLVVRGGVIQDRREFFFEKSEEVEPAAFLEAFLPQVYDVNPFLPKEIQLPVAVPQPALLEEFLLTRRNAKVAVRVPRRGAARERVELANTNAQQRHRVRFRRAGGEDQLALERLARVDGGRGQLQAALTALDRIGVELPVVGLAKREEEIWLPDRPEPVRLARNDPALKLIQRLRDEAHRFAIKRHRGRRGKRMRETSLTSIPGIGPTKARILLKRFGSLSG